MKHDRFARLRSFFAIAVIAVTFLWAALSVYFREAEKVPDDVITLRISHWQLEAGVREGFNEIAKEYQKLHPNIRIHQEAIPEGTYGQWMTTQLIGGTAPDIMQVGYGVPPPVLISYLNRYFVPLSQYVTQPNLYNAGTDLEGVPLMQTFKDEMRAGYKPELQEFMLVPLAMFGVRIFYNKDLLKELTGLTTPPATYEEFIDTCKNIRAQQDAKGRHYIPIASSKFHMVHWQDFMFDPLTYSVLYLADFNRDGFVSKEEFFVAIKSGRLDWDEPAIRLRFQMVDEVSDYFQTGYTGLTRDEAVFLFAQQRAVFITTGTWDARSLKEQAQGAFDVGLMSFPRPTRENPVYGKLIEGPMYEMPATGFLFGITRFSPHFEEALDFLNYLSSRQGNEKFNDIIGWLPAIKGAEVSDVLADFEPNLQGIYANAAELTITLGGESWIRYQQLYSLFQVDQIEYEDMARQYHEYYMQQGMKDYQENAKDWRRVMISDERTLAELRERMRYSEGLKQQSLMVKYIVLLRDRLITTELLFFDNERYWRGDVELEPIAPYEYTDRANENIRNYVAEQLAAEEQDAPDGEPEAEDSPQPEE